MLFVIGCSIDGRVDRVSHEGPASLVLEPQKCVARKACRDDIKVVVTIDVEETLQGMADITGGNYYRAEDAEQLYDVFLNLPNEIVLQKDLFEITVLFSLLGAIFLFCAAVLSLIWHRFP